MEVLYKDFIISNDKDKINNQVVLDYLQRSYWANQRPSERILKSIETSKCFGVYHDDRQIGFARVVTDEATIFYLCDVFVLEEYQGLGIGKKLIEVIVSSEEYAGMKGILATRDAHGLYEKYGFEKDPESYMRRTASGSKPSLPENEKG
ncbi:GNAT family N-acetyltransferase [Paenibacillus caui]|uniref:GNAT family N-acetyltransferase n=1 Tax=Paenibacillus caui TaxID=2873927 RepID=UPI001CA9D036|nr:GNAT family N-acetyltransferase [Paenibacillus caui]